MEMVNIADLDQDDGYYYVATGGGVLSQPEIKHDFLFKTYFRIL